MGNKVAYAVSGYPLHLSDEAIEMLRAEGVENPLVHFADPSTRHDPRLIKVIEAIDEKAFGRPDENVSFEELKERVKQHRAGYPGLCIVGIAEVPGDRYRILLDKGNERVEYPEEIEWTVIS
jgi:hypothetical protein